jgi:tRNA-dihydrouridine synthase B
MNSLSLGKITFSTNLIQGPLAGVSCAPFRQLTWEYGQPAFCCTEMISCKTLLHKSLKSQQRFIAKHPDEGPVCFQLSSTDPTELAEVVKIVTDHGADLIDLNCGCPVKKIRKRGAGSGHLSNTSKLFDLITAMKQNTHVPVSIKIRVDGDSNDENNAEVVKAIADAGADFVTVHGRHWTERYDVACRYDEIAFFVDALTIPVIGNGDVADVGSLKRMLATGCAGAMIGRAGVGQPWLIKRLQAELNGEIFIVPSNIEIGQMFIKHVQGLMGLFEREKFAILQARSIAKYYARKLPNRAEFCLAMNGCESYADFEKIVHDFFSH